MENVGGFGSIVSMGTPTRLILASALALGFVHAAPPGASFGIAHKGTCASRRALRPASVDRPPCPLPPMLTQCAPCASLLSAGVDPADSRPAGSWGGNPWPAHTEIAVYNHTCSCAGSATCACAMQHMWTGGAWDGYELSRVRYYIDGEAVASVDIPIGMGTGQPFNDDDGPWSAGVAFGKTGFPSGTFVRRMLAQTKFPFHYPFSRNRRVWQNTFAIPFSKSIKASDVLSLPPFHPCFLHTRFTPLLLPPHLACQYLVQVTVELLGAKPSAAFWCDFSVKMIDFRLKMMDLLLKTTGMFLQRIILRGRTIPNGVIAIPGTMQDFRLLFCLIFGWLWTDVVLWRHRNCNMGPAADGAAPHCRE